MFVDRHYQTATVYQHQARDPLRCDATTLEHHPATHAVAYRGIAFSVAFPKGFRAHGP